MQAVPKNACRVSVAQHPKLDTHIFDVRRAPLSAGLGLLGLAGPVKWPTWRWRGRAGRAGAGSSWVAVATSTTLGDQKPLLDPPAHDPVALVRPVGPRDPLEVFGPEPDEGVGGSTMSAAWREVTAPVSASVESLVDQVADFRAGDDRRSGPRHGPSSRPLYARRVESKATVIYDPDCGFCRVSLALLLSWTEAAAGGDAASTADLPPNWQLRWRRSAVPGALRPLPLGTEERIDCLGT